MIDWYHVECDPYSVYWFWSCRILTHQRLGTREELFEPSVLIWPSRASDVDATVPHSKTILTPPLVSRHLVLLLPFLEPSDVYPRNGSIHSWILPSPWHCHTPIWGFDRSVGQRFAAVEPVTRAVSYHTTVGKRSEAAV